MRLQVEYARDSRSRSQGLMRRETLAPRSGMLFDFETPQRVQMWMKDTLIPLDMLFITEQGELVEIERGARPESLRIISSRHKVRYVLEINAGEARALEFFPGDRLVGARCRFTTCSGVP